MKKTAQKGSTSFIKRLERIHPHLMLIYMGIIGSSLLFLFLSLLFVVTAVQQPATINLPRSFAFSTAALLVSSYFAHQYLQHFKNDRASELSHSANALLITGIAFAISQMIGWQELAANGTLFSGKTTGAYLYLLSGLHLAHLVGGLIFTLVQALSARNLKKDAVKALIIFTNPYELVKARMLAVYWHFLDAVWLVLFVVFLILL